MDSNKLVDKIINGCSKMALVGQNGSGKTQQLINARDRKSNIFFGDMWEKSDAEGRKKLRSIGDSFENIFLTLFNNRSERLLFDFGFYSKKVGSKETYESRVIYKSVQANGVAQIDGAVYVVNGSNFQTILRFARYFFIVKRTCNFDFSDYKKMCSQLGEANSIVNSEIIYDFVKELGNDINDDTFINYIDAHKFHADFNREQSLLNKKPFPDAIDIAKDEFKAAHSNAINIVENSCTKYIENLYRKKFISVGQGGSWIVFNELVISLSKIMNAMLSRLFDVDIELSLFIDEPESGLHSNLAKEFGAFLNNLELPMTGISKTNVYITTHNSYLLSGFINNVEEIALCNGKEGNWANTFFDAHAYGEYKNELEKILDDNVGYSHVIRSIIENGFAHVLNSNLFEMKRNVIECFFHKNIILCEGASDYQLILLFLSGSEDVKILPTIGKPRLIALMMILNSFNQNCFGMFDADSGWNTINENISNQFKSTIINDSNLERSLKTIATQKNIKFPKSNLKSYVQRHLEYLQELKSNSKKIYINSKMSFKDDKGEDVYDSKESIMDFIKIARNFYKKFIKSKWSKLKLMNFDVKLDDISFINSIDQAS